MNTPEPNNPKLCLAMAKLLPEKIIIDESYSDRDLQEPRPRWLYDSTIHYYRRDLGILDTEWLYVMHLVEQTLKPSLLGTATKEWADYTLALAEVCNGSSHISATFNQRALAMCKVKGIEV